MMISPAQMPQQRPAPSPPPRPVALDSPVAVVWTTSTPTFTDTTTGQLGVVDQRADGLFVFRPDGDAPPVPVLEPGRFRRIEATVGGRHSMQEDPSTGT